MKTYIDTNDFLSYYDGAKHKKTKRQRRPKYEHVFKVFNRIIIPLF
jgi:hypothetical protein